MDNSSNSAMSNPPVDVLQCIADAVAGKANNIFQELIQCAATVLQTQYAFIGESSTDITDQVHILAFFNQGNYAPEFVYQLNGTPCQNVINQTFRFYPCNVQRSFTDPQLSMLNVEGYAAIPLFDSKGKAIGLMGVMDRHPLTNEALTKAILSILSVRAAAELERRYALQAKEHSDTSYRSLFESTEDAVFVHDIDSGVIIDANHTACHRYGYTRDEMLSIGIDELSSGVVPYTKRHALRYMALARAGESPVVEWHVRNKDGSLRWEEARFKRREIGGVARILLFSRDITERKHAEAERARYEAQLRQSQKMEAIGQLTGGIAHDFNNILTGVMGYIVMALERNAQAQDPQMDKYLQRVQRAVERARDLIQQMLTFSRGQRGTSRAIELGSLVRETIKLLESSLPPTIEIITDLDPRSPAINLDPVHLEQVIMNLCINARDAMHNQGKLVITQENIVCNPCVCTSCRKPINGEYVVLSVADTGDGIPDQILDRIFEPFFSTKEIGKGSGMGLAMAHGIVHEYGGHILVEKNFPKGTKFKFLLPPVAPQTRIESIEDGKSYKSSGVKLHGTILLVDDDATVREFMEDRLASWGLTVNSFSGANQALNNFQAQSEKYDLAIVDQNMPHMTGIELAHQLQVSRPDLSILLYTGYVDTSLEEQIKSAGVRALLKKPISEFQLLDHLRELLN